MKAVMYHYIRPTEQKLPWLYYLHLDDFRAQLDFLASSEGFVSKAAFLEALDGGPFPRGAVLTFDDALRDHYDFVLPELVDRKLFGIFYVPTRIYSEPDILDVHKIHMLIGKHGPQDILAALNGMIDRGILNEADISRFDSAVYRQQTADDAFQAAKKILNYFLPLEYRTAILNRLAERFDMPLLANDYYVTPQELRVMSDEGMIIGSHAVTHRLMSQLQPDEQEVEITESFRMLDDITGTLAVRTFCYPYGGFHSFTPETEAMLVKHGVKFSFNVEQRDIDIQDLRNRPQALPRFNCNQLPFGRASLGPQRAAQPG